MHKYIYTSYVIRKSSIWAFCWGMIFLWYDVITPCNAHKTFSSLCHKTPRAGAYYWAVAGSWSSDRENKLLAIFHLLLGRLLWNLHTMKTSKCAVRCVCFALIRHIMTEIWSLNYICILPYQRRLVQVLLEWLTFADMPIVSWPIVVKPAHIKGLTMCCQMLQFCTDTSHNNWDMATEIVVPAD